MSTLNPHLAHKVITVRNQPLFIWAISSLSEVTCKWLGSYRSGLDRHDSGLFVNKVSRYSLRRRVQGSAYGFNWYSADRLVVFAKNVDPLAMDKGPDQERKQLRCLALYLQNSLAKIILHLLWANLSQPSIRMVGNISCSVARIRSEKQYNTPGTGGSASSMRMCCKNTHLPFL